MLRLFKALGNVLCLINSYLRDYLCWKHDKRHKVRKTSLLVWWGAVEARLGHICYVGVAAVAKIVGEVFTVTFGVAHIIPLLALRAAVAMAWHAVACVIPRQWMVAFWVAHVIAHFADITVCENQAVPQGGIGDIVNAKLPGDVVGAKGIV